MQSTNHPLFLGLCAPPIAAGMGVCARTQKGYAYSRICPLANISAIITMAAVNSLLSSALISLRKAISNCSQEGHLTGLGGFLETMKLATRRMAHENTWLGRLGTIRDSATWSAKKLNYNEKGK